MFLMGDHSNDSLHNYHARDVNEVVDGFFLFVVMENGELVRDFKDFWFEEEPKMALK